MILMSHRQFNGRQISLVSGLSSYEIDREFLFKEELKPLMAKIQKCINEYIRPHDKLNRRDIHQLV